MSTEPGTGTAEPVAVPVCPRHPDRESYVRCQRCNRPTCPECQRPAAVGIQCVDCVREQNRGSRAARPARTVFGGAIGMNRAGMSTPYITIGIMAICIVVYVAQLSIGTSFTNRFLYAPFLTRAEPWRMVTSAFLHSPSTFLHIAFNMYALWLIGPYLEALFGWARFLAVYLICAFGGSVGFLLLSAPSFDGNWVTGAFGASGAVFGLFAAFVVVQRKLQRDATGMLVTIGLNFAIGFLPGLNIAWQAHLGGLVTGLACAAVLAYAPRDRRAVIQWAGLAVILVVLVVLTLVKVQVTPADYLPARDLLTSQGVL